MSQAFFAQQARFSTNVLRTLYPSSAACDEPGSGIGVLTWGMLIVGLCGVVSNRGVGSGSRWSTCWFLQGSPDALSPRRCDASGTYGARRLHARARTATTKSFLIQILLTLHVSRAQSASSVWPWRTPMHWF